MIRKILVGAFGVVLVLFVVLLGVAWRYGALFAEHEADLSGYPSDETVLRIALRPGADPDLIAQVAQSESAAARNTVQAFLPHQIALVVDSNREDKTGRIQILVNERRFGPVFADLATRKKLGMLVPGVEWTGGLERDGTGVLAAEGTFPFPPAVADLAFEIATPVQDEPALTEDQVVTGTIDNGDGTALAALLSLYVNQSENPPFFDPASLYAALGDIEHIAITSAPGENASLVVTFRIRCREDTPEADLERLALLIDLVSAEIGGPLNDTIGLRDTNEILRDGRDITWNWTLDRFDRIADRILGR